MARIAYQITEYELDRADCALNPECLMMRTQDDDTECDTSESMWLSGTAVTQPKQSHDYN